MGPGPLAGERVAFTGRLFALGREAAFEAVRRAGGEPSPQVTRATSRLVVGAGGWPLLPTGAVSRKLRLAEALILRGRPLRILSERAFLAALGLAREEAKLARPYGATEVCRLLGIAAETLRRWEAFGLVQSQAGTYDFQDLVSLRTIGRLLASGVRPETLAASLRDLARLLPGTGRPLAQLRLVAEGPRSLLVDLGDARAAPDGQLLLRFEPSRSRAPVEVLPATTALDATAWIERGVSLEAGGDPAGAVEAYRRALAIAPASVEAHFDLGNALRALGDRPGAEAAFREAVALDPECAEAWYNLADLACDAARDDEAIAWLQRALAAGPAYADAHFNLALCLERAGRADEARRHWRAYLALDPASQWARVARRRLRLRGSAPEG